MTSLLAKSALDKLPPEVRDHIIVENETGYSITLSMTIGDFERLVAPHSVLGEYREAAEEAEGEVENLRFGLTAVSEAADSCADAIETFTEVLEAAYGGEPDWPESVIEALADVEQAGTDARDAVVIHG